jgi:hypothetical protein
LGDRETAVCGIPPFLFLNRKTGRLKYSDGLFVYQDNILLF